MPHSTRLGGLFSMLTATLVLQLLSCSGDVVGPPRPPPKMSGITVHLTASGPNRDDVSLVSLDGAPAVSLSSEGTLVFLSIPSGKHSLAVSGLEENCKVDGPNPIVVDAPPLDVATVEIRVTCTSTTGVIAVTVASSGSWDPLSFSVQVDDGSVQQVLPNEKTPVGAFGAGAHVVKLFNVPPSCSVVGAASSPVSIPAGSPTQDTVEARLNVTCGLDGSGQDEGWEIAFQRGDSSIMLVREGGSATHTLTRGLAPSWSPDGKFLAYQRERCVFDWGCSDDLWVIRPNGSTASAITTGDGFLDSDPAISPDGRRITFIRFWLGPDQSYLMVSNVAGTAPRILSIWDPYSTPTWSPDGTQIAFTCAGPSPNWELDICMVKSAPGCTNYFVDDCELPQLTHLTNSRFVESEPAWSPDGSRIAITFDCAGLICPAGVVTNETYVALLDPVTHTVTPIMPGHSPAWSPDGKRLVFAGNSNSPGLKVIGFDGTGLRSLTDDSRDTAPSWRD